MNDLIRRKDAIDYFFTNIGVVDADGYAVDDYDERVKTWTESFSGIPSAEPERKKGQWIIRYFDMETYEYKEKVYNYYEKMPEGDVYCSECKESALLNGHEESVFSNFCPYCGADMRMRGEE